MKKTENETAHLNVKIVENQKELKSNVKSEVNRAQARTPKLPTFNEDKDDLDAYLIRYEHYAKVQGWQESDWALNLSALLTGSALEVYSRLSLDDASMRNWVH